MDREDEKVVVQEGETKLEKNLQQKRQCQGTAKHSEILGFGLCKAKN